MSETTTTTADEATVIAANIRHSCGFQYGRPSDRVLITRTARGWTRIADLLDELAQLRAATRWVPVSERNPVAAGFYPVRIRGSRLEFMWRRARFDPTTGWDRDDVGAWSTVPPAPPQPQALADDAGKVKK